MQLTLYKGFKKRINSTKRPSGGVTTNVVLKTGTSIENPIFMIDGIDLDVNYCQALGHYYFINDIILGNNNIYELHCSQDLLATYKNDILNTHAYVEYSTSSFDSKILDKRISQNTEITRRSNTVTPWATNFMQESYVLTVNGANGTADNYRCTKADLLSLGTFLSNLDLDETQLKRITTKYGSLSDTIINCMWLPYKPIGVASTIHLAEFDTEISAAKIPGVLTDGGSVTVNIPWINTDTARRINETIELYLPGYGLTQLPANKYMGLTSLTIKYKSDITGGITYSIVNSGGTVEYFNANVGATVPITSYYNGTIRTMLSGATSLASGAGGAVNSLIASGLSIIGDFIGDIGHSSSSTGGYGGATLGYSMQQNSDIVITNYSYSYTEEQADMAELYGRPLYTIKSLSTLTGYVKCNGASINVDGLANDKAEINSYLNSGFYIE